MFQHIFPFHELFAHRTSVAIPRTLYFFSIKQARQALFQKLALYAR